jgi:hypothetical protein
MEILRAACRDAARRRKGGILLFPSTLFLRYYIHALAAQSLKGHACQEARIPASAMNRQESLSHPTGNIIISIHLVSYLWTMMADPFSAVELRE